MQKTKKLSKKAKLEHQDQSIWFSLVQSIITLKSELTRTTDLLYRPALTQYPFSWD